MSRITVQNRIDHARGRLDKYGCPRPERTINLTFSIERTRALVREFGLDESRHGIATIVEEIGKRLGVAATGGLYRQTIADRIHGKSSVSFSFSIGSVYTLCARFRIDPETSGEDVLADRIFGEVMAQRAGRAAAG